jgi:hypothetical protein
MEKAYDFKALMDELKAQGIEVAEEVVKAITISALNWLDKSAQMSPNMYDDVLRAVYPIIKEKLLALEDKINPNG